MIEPIAGVPLRSHEAAHCPAHILNGSIGEPTRAVFLLLKKCRSMYWLASCISIAYRDGSHLILDRLRGISDFVSNGFGRFSHGNPEEAKGRWTPNRPLGRHDKMSRFLSRLEE